MLHKFYPLQKLKTNINTVQNSIESIHKEVENTHNYKQNILTSKIDVQESVIKQNDLMCRDINHYLKNFKERELIKTIKSQISDVAKRQKEVIQKRRAEIKTTKNKLKDIKQEEDRSKLDEGLQKLRRQQDLLAKIQSKCNVKDIKDLVTYHNYLNTTREQLLYQNNILEVKREEKTKQLFEMKERLNNIILYKESDVDNNKINVEQTLKWIANEDAYLQPHINDYVNEKNIAINDNYKIKIQHLHKLLTNWMMLIYRISWQLKEGKSITKENVVVKLSSVGLRLEHMIATLAKNKQNNYNLESINTDTSYKYPPEFMGIKYFYVNPAATKETESETKENKPSSVGKSWYSLLFQIEDEETQYLKACYEFLKNGGDKLA